MKDHECFLAAAGMLKQRVPEAQFLCAGNGPAGRRTALLETAANLGLAGSVHWIPACAEMRALYSALDVFCLSSQYGEGFPNVLGEAMACARPCVTTDVGDAALVAGAAARVVPRRSPRELSNAIEASLGKKSAPEARRRIVSEFSVDRMVDTTERLLLSWAGAADGLYCKAHYA
jgi:glycosyltransferase involved in cell wall biosynthesis